MYGPRNNMLLQLQLMNWKTEQMNKQGNGHTNKWMDECTDKRTDKETKWVSEEL